MDAIEIKSEEEILPPGTRSYLDRAGRQWTWIRLLPAAYRQVRSLERKLRFVARADGFDCSKRSFVLLEDSKAITDARRSATASPELLTFKQAKDKYGISLRFLKKYAGKSCPILRGGILETTARIFEKGRMRRCYRLRDGQVNQIAEKLKPPHGWITGPEAIERHPDFNETRLGKFSESCKYLGRALKRRRSWVLRRNGTVYEDWLYWSQDLDQIAEAAGDPVPPIRKDAKGREWGSAEAIAKRFKLKTARQVYDWYQNGHGGGKLTGIWIQRNGVGAPQRLEFALDEVPKFLAGSPAQKPNSAIDDQLGRRLPQKQAAKFCGVSITALRRYATGKSPVPGGKLQVIAEEGGGANQKGNYYFESELIPIRAARLGIEPQSPATAIAPAPAASPRASKAKKPRHRPRESDPDADRRFYEKWQQAKASHGTSLKEFAGSDHIEARKRVMRHISNIRRAREEKAS